MRSESSSKHHQADFRVSGQLVGVQGTWSVCSGAGMSPGCAHLRNIIKETVLVPELTEFLVALPFYRGEDRQGIRWLLFPVCREMVSIKTAVVTS